ncbi:WRKY transcription factor 28-like [Diospyros lotus]|uniref:WRKY transcription factor 28-like n=1 Tax=Diospyros lotus TaxID=55363 RepID=UPI00224EDFD2|nr:WRKY transcription factor 28-like [Diospyros lotus]
MSAERENVNYYHETVQLRDDYKYGTNSTATGFSFFGTGSDSIYINPKFCSIANSSAASHEPQCFHPSSACLSFDQVSRGGFSGFFPPPSPEAFSPFKDEQTPAILGGEDNKNSTGIERVQHKELEDGGQSFKKLSKSLKKNGEARQREVRFSFMTRSRVDLLEDGYRWRKYGQKAVKNSHFPRSYYRCTAEKCNVKKHVERSLQDPSIVITTYQGRHSHPALPTFRGNATGRLPPASMVAPPPLAHGPSASCWFREREDKVQMAPVWYDHGGMISSPSLASGHKNIILFPVEEENIKI